MMRDILFTLAGEEALLGNAPGTEHRCLRSDDDVRAAYRQHQRGMWVLHDATPLLALVGADTRRRRAQRLLVLAPLSPERRQLFEALFERVVARSPELVLLSNDELMEVMPSSERQDLLIGGAVDAEARTIVLLRGSLEPVVVPFGWFKRRRGGPRPSFDDFEIIDAGQTMRLGNYEAATDALLFEVDADYRKRARQRELEQDDSFGGALKRLRLLRGLKRADFDGITAKEVARIERGEVKTPHSRTLELLAGQLGVTAEEIASY